MQDAECHHERGNGKKKTRKYYFSLSVSGLDGIFDVVYGGIKESKSIPIFLQSDPRLTPTQPLFLQHLYLFLLFFFFFFLSCLVFIRDQRCTSTDTLHVCSHTWSTVLFPRSHLKLRSELEFEKKLRNSVQICSLGGCEPVMAVSYLVTWYSIFAVFTLELPLLRSKTPCLFEDAAERATGFVLMLVVLFGSTAHSFSHTLRETLPCLLRWEVNLSPHCFSKCNTTLASLIWSTVTSTGHLLSVQQLLQLFHFASLLFQCDHGANCSGVSLFLWMPNEFPQDNGNCSKKNHFWCTLVWQNIER